ncbi:probable lipid-A-disaccharide synthase, mitochondrial isoform X2 [Malus sylvestris]|uniref:probable lipid-A-disaccharide synthase, mitochondrial isoform X2 n=1 Tax=Malus sylvestris TaxID=3752 RepID=UPI0021AD02CA|nr:probable lipid-A-disaccharide synthase, mitochondrial isoform X2 [Malus sylvestris]
MLRRYSGMWFRKLWNVDGENFVGFSRLIRRYVSVSSTSEIDVAVRDGELRVFIVSGEVSGDTIGSRLMASLKNLCPVPVRFSGVGGLMMSKHGLKSLFPMEDIAVMGLLELLPHLNRIRVKLLETLEAALLFQPHVVVTVDSKGFSFRLLKQLRARYNQQRVDAPVHFHYVAPSFWAWKGGEARLRGLAGFVDHVLCILPNEEEVCRSNGLAATFVGHPILEDVLELKSDTSPHELKIEGNCEDFRRRYAIPAGAKVISLLPGSRLQEVTRMLSIFANTMGLLKVSFPELVTVIHVAPNQHVKNYVAGMTNKWPVPAILIPGGSPHQKYDAFSASSVALCASGTVALEMQLARLPCVVAYRAHFLTEWIIRYKAKIPYISLPNILMDSPIIPEALFQACTPTNLASLILGLIHDDGLREKQIVAAGKVIRLLCTPARNSDELVEQHQGGRFPHNTPSVIAATAILHHAKP